MAIIITSSSQKNFGSTFGAAVEDMDAFGEIDTLRGLRIRYISFSDAFRGQRDDWVGRAFGEVELFSYVDNDISPISRVTKPFDVLVVGGSDIARISKYIRSNAFALTNIVKVACVDNSNATKRAKLLLSGFDDVFDPATMADREARARLLGLRRRYELMADRSMRDQASEREFQRVTNGLPLGKKEKRLLSVLLDNRGTLLSYERIGEEVSGHVNDISRRHLAVMICNLRKKLREGVEINCVGGEGYMLCYDDR